MVLPVLGDPRISRLREWWTPQTFERALNAAQEALRQQGAISTRYYVALRLGGLDVRTLQRYLYDGCEPEDRTLRFIDDGLKEILGDDWLERLDDE